ncbi:hypothetical protein ES319_D06G161800v1 [Gossypium barbadense]|uniref:DUF1685 domain-containing protein n=1 Tax=Gossypium barbadense TaxID=3634 RepID=A0A5J5R355_GOSBA|nr:hypothetical protein ES319_D06G161800v1 [Gossypium barbadense]
MEIEEIMNLFDSCWFEMEILKKQTSQSTSTSFEPNPDRKTEGNSSKPELKRTQSTLHSRSMSDQLSLNRTSFVSSYDSFSPDSVLQSPNLHKTISGKEIAEEELKETCSNMRITRRKKGRRSKSLSELEFEELKGFMDLGFVFSEEDNKDSRLVEIIPGLQRLRRKESQEEDTQEADDDDDDDDDEVSRPYLSEAWKVSERRKTNPLMNWRVPDLGNEINMKDSLRWWAHTVASTVR